MKIYSVAIVVICFMFLSFSIHAENKKVQEVCNRWAKINNISDTYKEQISVEKQKQINSIGNDLYKNSFAYKSFLTQAFVKDIKKNNNIKDLEFYKLLNSNTYKYLGKYPEDTLKLMYISLFASCDFNCEPVKEFHKKAWDNSIYFVGTEFVFLHPIEDIDQLTVSKYISTNFYLKSELSSSYLDKLKKDWAPMFNIDYPKDFKYKPIIRDYTLGLGNVSIIENLLTGEFASAHSILNSSAILNPQKKNDRFYGHFSISDYIGKPYGTGTSFKNTGNGFKNKKIYFISPYQTFKYFCKKSTNTF